VSESVSFRISRTAEDLAQTVAALSKRLVSLEQRLGALELQGASLQAQLRAVPEADPAELACLDAVDQLLADCRSLLAETELPIREPSVNQAPSSEPPIAELPSAEALALEPGPAEVPSDQDWDALEDLEDEGVETGRPDEETLTLAVG
jgi:hypothetical protein